MHKINCRSHAAKGCLLLLTILILALSTGCQRVAETYFAWKDNFIGAFETVAPAEEVQQIETVLFSDEDAAPIRDNPVLYEQDDDDSVVTMYLTVSKGNASENTNHTWSEVNGHSIYYYEDLGIERYGCEALLQIGNEDGPKLGEFGYGRTTPNATVTVRGATTSLAAQKSYKISLQENAGLWRQQRIITLNKHAYERMRFSNKLCYDLMESIPALLGQRTQFVHLYVRDLTTEDADTSFIDYGLYTQIEQPNKRYLKNHGWDSQGQFYQIKSFNFQLNDALKLATDPSFDQTAFDAVLEVKGSNDHRKLLEMLAAVNDESQPIEQVFSRYFDAENYFSWLAFNILTGNIDTEASNAYLYSPTASDKWYLVCWDCDAAFNRYSTIGTGEDADFGYNRGFATYWNSPLHRRMLTLPANRALLDEKIQELYAYLSRERIQTQINGYQPIVKKYLFRQPDINYARVTEAQWDEMFLQIPNEIERNYQMYLETLEEPMPFWIGSPLVATDNTMQFVWDTAYDFDEENITYRFILSDNLNLDDPLATADGLQLPQYTYSGTLAPGEYFCFVEATNSSGHTQRAFDCYNDTSSTKHYGILCFYVMEDGKIVVKENEINRDE